VADAELDLLVLGSGVAGLSAAVRAAEAHQMRVGVLTKGPLPQSTTRWAQGGVAAVLNEDPDSTDLHLADTLAAGAGLCDPDAVRVLVDEGPLRVHDLIALGAIFDRDAHGELELAREGGHTLARVVHAGGSATGAEVERALVDAVQRTIAAVHENAFALDLLVEGGRCRGVSALFPDGSQREVRATNVLVTTGGAGQMFAVTTNPVEATGDGIAMALRAGVAVADIEFVQFHPTALHHEAMPRPLLSEALRGHGALLRDTNGARFVDEMQPRDVVSRAETQRMLELGVDHVFLDATDLEDFDRRFPNIAAALREVGLDPATDWLPVAPAAHYTCGGIVTDLQGASALPGLWAAGEAACSGVHGANRLASNSLLEGMVFGPRAVEAIETGVSGPAVTGAMRAVLVDDARWGSGMPGSDADIDGGVAGRVLTMPSRWTGRAERVDAVTARRALQRTMTLDAGVVRSAGSLARADGMVQQVHAGVVGQSLAECEVRNLTLVARALVVAAAAREESRGAHTRTDFPTSDASQRHRLVLLSA